MSTTDSDLSALAEMVPGACRMTEGDKLYVYLPRLAVRVGESVRFLDGLLCPGNHSGYETRLFLSEPVGERPTINGNPANWTAHQILGRAWHVWSWQGVSAGQPLPSMVAAHLGALR